MSTAGVVIAIAVLTGFLACKLKIIPEDQRRAVYALGKFAGFKGPGLVFKWSGGETEWKPVAVGERGELLDSGLAGFGETKIPVTLEGEARIGELIRIRAFEEDKAIVIRDHNQSRVFRCQRCGHENRIRP
jgi:regulator of protease activity HflC (stomatin/prohibitin superfamily)